MKVSMTLVSVLVLAMAGSAAAGIKRKSLGLCQLGCERDLDCAKGLWCSERHRLGLINSGFDRRKANCAKGLAKDKYIDVCFDPKILKIKGGGGGGE